MLKRVIRKELRILRNWLNTDKNITPKQIPSYSEYSYQWLNHYLFPKLLEEGGKALRGNYVWGVLQGVNLAKALGIKRVSVLEFGVAGGNGLVSLEKAAETIESIYKIEIDVYGFDTGFGLPKPTDYRDEPHVYVEGQYKMDMGTLQKRLRKAKLILGLVNETIADFIKGTPAPVAFVSIDLDLYSSSMHALRLLDAQEELLLPRIFFYFDDIMGLTKNVYAGERLAMSAFNESHKMIKITPIYGLKYHLPRAFARNAWVEKFFIAHIFCHKLYGIYDGLSAPAPDLSLNK
jgi:hypothetical protein